MKVNTLPLLLWGILMAGPVGGFPSMAISSEIGQLPVPDQPRAEELSNLGSGLLKDTTSGTSLSGVLESPTGNQGHAKQSVIPLPAVVFRRSGQI